MSASWKNTEVKIQMQKYKLQKWNTHLPLCNMSLFTGKSFANRAVGNAGHELQAEKYAQLQR